MTVLELEALTENRQAAIRPTDGRTTAYNWEDPRVTLSDHYSVISNSLSRQ